MDNSRILVIDDDVDILAAMQIILSNAGFDVVTASSGQAARSKFQAQRPALVLCDMMMETIDEGLQLAASFKRMDPSVPVILISSVGDGAQGILPVGDVGFDGVLQKPVASDELVSMIRRKLGS